MSTYLKNMAGYKHNQLKSQSYDKIQEMFDKEIKRVNTFVDMITELVKGSKTKAEGSSKRSGDELEQEKAKKQKGDDDQEEEEIKKAYRDTDGSSKRPEDDYERVLWGDLKVMFEPDIKSEVWRSLQEYKVTVWKLFDNCGVHFVRFKNLHIFMLVEKRYPLTLITISNMLNKKLQADRWNKMCYQLIKLMTKQEKGQ
ncbi:hypothetical protein Tco_1370594 [Tanacetum coccineum]